MGAYLNACSHGLMDAAVTRRMMAHLARVGTVGEVAAAGEVADELATVRREAARAVGGAVAGTGLSAATGDAWRDFAARLSLAGRRVLVAPHEWGENIRFLQAMAARGGGRVEVLPPLDSDAPDLAPWRARMEEDVAALFVPMVTSVAGARYPVEAIGALPRPEGMLYVVDAAQALGQVSVDAGAIGCDALFATTRKWVRGPYETGLYWLAPRATAATGLVPRAGNLAPAPRLGQGVALRLMREAGPGTGPASALLRREAAARGLDVLPGGTGAVTLRLSLAEAAPVRAALARASIVAKWPDPETDEPAAGLAMPGSALLRLSPHRYNTGEEVLTALDTAMAALPRTKPRHSPCNDVYTVPPTR